MSKLCTLGVAACLVLTWASAFCPAPLSLAPGVRQARGGRAGRSPKAVLGNSGGDALSTASAAAGALPPDLATALAPLSGAGGTVALALLAVAYLLVPPNVLMGLIDMALRAIEADSEQRWGPDDIGPKVGRTLGRGNFGTVIESFVSESGAAKLQAAGGGERGARVVQKRCVDEEQAEIEAYFNRRVRRLVGAEGFASFLGSSRRAGDALSAGRLLVWRYEGSKTLEQFLEEPKFPRNLEQLVLRREVPADVDDEVRSDAVIREVMRQCLTAIKALHDAGVVHRDIKPANMVVSELPTGSPILVVDLGAAVDLRNGINFNPEVGILDPRYAPPELYVIPQTVRRAPPALLALLASPVLWAQHTPDRFDTYSAGMTLLQMAIPQLRRSDSLKTVTTKMGECQGDIKTWRANFGGSLDFSLLDRRNGAGWDLVVQLLKPRAERLSAGRALSHRFFNNENLGSAQKAGAREASPAPSAGQQQQAPTNGLLLGRK